MSYVFTYNGTDAPLWEKVFTSESGETFSVSLVFENQEDRMQLTAEQAYQHMTNMLNYVKDRTQNLELVQLDQEPASFWPFVKDYDEIELTVQEIQKWWNWAYYNDSFQSSAE